MKIRIIVSLLLFFSFSGTAIGSQSCDSTLNYKDYKYLDLVNFKKVILFGNETQNDIKNSSSKTNKLKEYITLLDNYSKKNNLSGYKLDIVNLLIKQFTCNTSTNTSNTSTNTSNTSTSTNFITTCNASNLGKYNSKFEICSRKQYITKNGKYIGNSSSRPSNPETHTVTRREWACSTREKDWNNSKKDKETVIKLFRTVRTCTPAKYNKAALLSAKEACAKAYKGYIPNNARVDSVSVVNGSFNEINPENYQVKNGMLRTTGKLTCSLGYYEDVINYTYYWSKTTATDKTTADKIAADKIAADKIAKDKALAAKIAAEKAAAKLKQDRYCTSNYYQSVPLSSSHICVRNGNSISVMNSSKTKCYGGKITEINKSAGWGNVGSTISVIKSQYYHTVNIYTCTKSGLSTKKSEGCMSGYDKIEYVYKPMFGKEENRIKCLKKGEYTTYKGKKYLPGSTVENIVSGSSKLFVYTPSSNSKLWKVRYIFKKSDATVYVTYNVSSTSVSSIVKKGPINSCPSNTILFSTYSSSNTLYCVTNTSENRAKNKINSKYVSKISINGICNNLVPNTCISGKMSFGKTDTSTYRYWSCLGINGGKNVTNCKKRKSYYSWR